MLLLYKLVRRILRPIPIRIISIKNIFVLIYSNKLTQNKIKAFSQNRGSNKY